MLLRPSLEGGSDFRGGTGIEVFARAGELAVDDGRDNAHWDTGFGPIGQRGARAGFLDEAIRGFAGDDVFVTGIPDCGDDDRVKTEKCFEVDWPSAILGKTEVGRAERAERPCIGTRRGVQDLTGELGIRWPGGMVEEGLVDVEAGGESPTRRHHGPVDASRCRLFPTLWRL